MRNGAGHERVPFAEPVLAPRGASHDGDDAEHAVGITLDGDRVWGGGGGARGGAYSEGAAGGR